MSTGSPVFEDQAASDDRRTTSHRESKSAPWVVIAGGFHRNGGMDKANLALAQYLVERGTPVHIVCHGIEQALAHHPLVTAHVVSRPASSYFLGRPLLDFKGRQVARQIRTKWPDARVVVNGDNCLTPGINWVHYVHHAWRPRPVEGPLWFRAKHGLNDWHASGREREAARIARVFITNSNRTKGDLINLLQVDAFRIHTVYLGAESEWGLVTPEERALSRKALAIPEDRPLAVFIGSIGHDRRKGFDVLLEAWRRLCTDPAWDVDLLLVGSGSALPDCRKQVAEWKLGDRIRVIGFSERVRELLGVSDLLVSPVRYEAYGLNVQEAICRGVPAIVTANAGVAEKYGPEYTPLLLPDPEDVADLASRLLAWRSNMREWKARFERFGQSLLGYGWQDMARSMVALVDELDQSGFKSNSPL